MDDIIYLIVVIIISWNIFGMFLDAAIGESGSAYGFEFLNPIWIYNHYHVNYFGATMVCILYNLICPIASICYWFYKLCTVGRK